MKHLIGLLMLCSIFFSFDKSAPKVLIFVKEDVTPQQEYMLTNEVGKMQEILNQAGFDAKIATVSGGVISAGSVTVNPDLKLSEVKIDEYEGFILPCMTLDTATPDMIAFVKAAAEKNKPIAAQAGSVVILAKAGLLKGKKYALNSDASSSPDFQGGIYSGTGIVQDGTILTSGICPWLAKQTGNPDGTPILTQTLVETIKTKGK